MKYLSLIFSLSLLVFAGCWGSDDKPAESSQPTSVAQVLTLTVVDCAGCDAGVAAEQVKAKALPDLNINVIQQSSAEAQRLMKKFDPKYLPLFVFNEVVKNSAIKTYLSDITTEKDKEYMLLPDNVGLRTSKELLKTIDSNTFDHRSLGTADSPVQIVEFSDFECPYCGKFNEETYSKIKEKYGDQVSFTFKNYPLEFHKFAQKASEAAQCAADQGKFVAMHDILFQNNTKLEVANLKSYAKTIGLNQADFNKCLDSGAKKTEVDKQGKDGKAIDITGTPAFVINGKTFIGGAYPFEYFEKILDGMLGMNQKL